MPRGKNYVNNDKGVTLKSHKKSASMEPCFYGTGCTRRDCIYRHDIDVPDAKKSQEPCLSFLAGTCSFTATTCKKRHPEKEEAERLKAKYSKINCRFGDDCRTNSCLYTHPRDRKNKEPAFLGQAAFPPLASGGGGNTAGDHGKAHNKPPPPMLPGSAWRAAPVVAPPADATPTTPQHHKQMHQPATHEQPPTPTTPISAQAPAWFPGNPQEESTQLQQHPYGGFDGGYHHVPIPMIGDMPGPVHVPIPTSPNSHRNLNVNAKAWVPGGGY